MFRFAQKENILKLTLILACVLVAGGAVCGAVSALTYQQDIGVSFTFNPSIAVTLSSANLTIPNLTPGTASDSNIITVNVKTNNVTGYTLNATVGNNTTYNTRDLKHQSNTVTDKFSSVDFGSNIAANTDLTDNTWAYSFSLDDGGKWLAISDGAPTDGYSGLPLYSDETNIATLKASTGPAESASGDDIRFKIAARASNEITSGEYNNVINFVAVANPEPQPEPISCSGANKICYSANSLGTVEGTMGEQDANASTSVELLASNFSQAGYGFAGWSDAYDYATNANAHFYGPQETITTPADMSAGLPLYAVWVKSAGDLQSWSGCSSLTKADEATNILTQSITALSDQRDNNTYAIAKLADGNCWMIENLRLESTNSDNSTGALAQGYGGQFAGLADAEPAWTNNLTTANSLYYSGTQDSTATIDIGTSNPAYRFPRYNHDNTNSRASAPTTNDLAMYSYGNYYTWPAAIADTTAYTTNNQSVEDYSICPTGWHLPTGGGAYASGNTGGVNVTGDPSTFREFYNLGYKIMNEVKTAYEDTPNGVFSYYSSNTTNTAGKTATAAFRSYPNNFVYSGRGYSGSVDSRGSYGLYWSSTAGSSSYAYELGLGSSYVSPGTNSSGKYVGRAVRCVASGA